MAKKKTTVKKAGSRQAAAKKRATKKRAPGSRAAKTAKKPAAKKKGARQVPLGRPKISADEKLYLLFREDYHARQIFDFLRAESVRDLEAHRPADIIKRLSAPIQESVERIRRRLAEYNRYLAGDEDYVRRQRATKTGDA